MKHNLSREQIRKLLESIEIKPETGDICKYWGRCSALTDLADNEISRTLKEVCLGNYENCLKYMDLEDRR